MWAGVVGLYATIFFVQMQQKSISAAIPHALTKHNHFYSLKFLKYWNKISVKIKTICELNTYNLKHTT